MCVCLCVCVGECLSVYKTVHAFVTNRHLLLFLALYAGLPACRLGCLDRVLHSAARLFGGIPKFGHVSEYMRDVLHWLPAEHRISYSIASWSGAAHLALLLSTFVSSVVLSLVLHCTCMFSRSLRS